MISPIENKSKAALKRLQYQEDMSEWLQLHQSKIATSTISEEYAENQQNRKQYKALLRSLRFDSNPKAMAAIILDPILKQDHLPASENEEAAAGSAMKLTIQREIDLDPTKKIISPALILTEARRKVLLEKLMAGGIPDENRLLRMNEIAMQNSKALKPKKIMHSSISSDSSVNSSNSSSAYQDSTRSNFRKKEIEVPLIMRDEKPHSYAFHPRWENYNTMKHRWNYILPQLKEFIAHDSMLLPNSTSSLLPVQGVKLNGNYNDLDNFKKRVQASGARNLMYTNNGSQTKRTEA